MRKGSASRSGWREEDGPRAEAVPGLGEEREPREAAEGQLGEAQVGERHVREERLALGKVLVKGEGELASAALLLIVERGERG
jgi:hypothetical protein